MKDLVETNKIKERELAILGGMTVKELKSIKDAMLQLKQGEALERSSWPRDQLEAFGLGYFGYETLYAIDLIDTLEDSLNEIGNLKDRSMHVFAGKIAVGSGSRGAKRLELTLDAVGRLGGSVSLPSKEFPTPEHLGARQPDK